MWTHLKNSDILLDNNVYYINAYFIKDDGTELNTGIGFDHTPSLIEITEAVDLFYKTLV